MRFLLGLELFWHFEIVKLEILFKFCRNFYFRRYMKIKIVEFYMLQKVK